VIPGQGDNQVPVIKISIKVANVSKQEYIKDYSDILEKDIKEYISLLDYISASMGKTIMVWDQPF
jgi:hypothetical protein